MGAMTYWDINKVVDDCNAVCREVNRMWIAVIMDSTLELLKAQSAGMSDKQMEAAEHKVKKAMSKCGDEVMDKVSKMVAEASIDAYNHGFSEGAHDAEQEFCKHYHMLVEEGKLDFDPKMEKFVGILKTVSNSKFADSHKGEHLMVDTRDLFDDLNTK